ncbi:type II toxin-antitoxin system VapB family antitoxin [Zavarzinia compransoris]|uniref:type II toxin-antitoxin system VapB family antitoxin n=1 Tax=Zavarzinia marina TaxID=2911065 RepID=UPI001F3D125B|nr:type II toxin-antitoxin system VapB family antitoxin [Zavarzinia marina]MCF4165531.1 type II toxin-antitoxin system VapB family antitoxin [Zavarzinia marina]
MRTTIILDDELLSKARTLTGLTNRSALVREALKALLERESAGRLGQRGGTEQDAAAVLRRRADRA